MTFCCVGLGWLAASTRRQRKASQALTALGANVYYDDSELRSGLPAGIRYRLAAKLDWIDRDLLLPVTAVYSQYLEAPSLRRGARYTPKSILDPLPGLAGLRSLSLTHCEIENEDLDVLAQLNRLTDLNLSMTRLHEGPILGLESCDLTNLRLARTRVDDETMKSVVKLKGLEYLDLTRTKVGGKGLQLIGELPKLRTLLIRRCLVTRDEYLAFQKHHPNVKVRWEPLTAAD